jgi:hypothetical protein
VNVVLNDIKHLKGASRAFEQSLKCLPKRDFLQFSELVSSQTVLSASQELPLIPNIIYRYINSTFVNCPDSQFTPIQDIFLEAGYNFIDFAGLLEYVLRVFKERVLDSHNIQFNFLNVEKTLMNTLLTCYLPEDYPIRRARSIFNFHSIIILYYLFLILLILSGCIISN